MTIRLPGGFSLSWEDHENRSLFKSGKKRCSKCGKVKALDDFHRAPKKLYFTGRKSACKACSHIRKPIPSKVWDKMVRHTKENKLLVKRGKKRCWKCKRVKLLSLFWANSWGGDGYKNVCVPCDKGRTRAWSIKSNRKIRMEALDRYGGKCFCCGESNFEFLAIDHIGPRGTGNRQRISGVHKPGNGFMKWLKRNKWPKKFRVSCHNCNSSMGYYGYCPHKNAERAVLTRV